MLPLTIEGGTITVMATPPPDGLAPYQATKVINIGYSHLVWHYLFMAGLGGLAVAAAMLRRGSRLLWGGVTVLATVAGVRGVPAPAPPVVRCVIGVLAR